MHVPVSPQDLPLRTCTGTCNDLWEQISPRSAQDFLIRACTKSCQDLWQDFRMIFITSAHKELYKTLVKIFIYYEPLRLDCETIARSSYNNLPQNSWNLFFRISGTQLKSSPHHNESNPTGTEWREACASNDKSRTAPQRDRSDTHKGDERVAGFSNLFVEVCKVLPCHAKLARGQPGQSFCARLRTWNAHGHLGRELWRKNFKWRSRGQQSVSWSNPAFHTYRKNPSMWTHCLGKKHISY